MPSNQHRGPGRQKRDLLAQTKQPRLLPFGTPGTAGGPALSRPWPLGRTTGAGTPVQQAGTPARAAATAAEDPSRQAPKACGEATVPPSSQVPAADGVPLPAMPEPAGHAKRDTPGHAPKLSKDNVRARAGPQAMPQPVADSSAQPACHAHAGSTISLKQGTLHRPKPSCGSEPSSRELHFTRKAPARRTAALQRNALEKASSKRDSEWSSTSTGQQDADISDPQLSVGMNDLNADISLGGSLPNTRQPHAACKGGPEQAKQPAAEGDAAGDKGLDEEPVRDVPHQSPPPPVRTLDDGIAEQAQARQQAGTPPAKLARKASAAATYAPGASQGICRAAGTVADPVVISDSDSEADMPEVSDLHGKSDVSSQKHCCDCHVATECKTVQSDLWLISFLLCPS